MNIKRLILVAALVLPLGAGAVEYTQIQPDKSSLTFAYKQMGVPMEGKFRRFSGRLSFDPARPAAAKAALEVELASIDTGSAEANDEVVSKPWFNAKAYPVAQFVASTIKPLGGNRYEVAGKLTLKGVTRDVVAPVTLTPQGTQAILDGAFTLKRAGYAIGEGVWADFSTVANDIQIRFRLLATGK